MTLWVDCNPKKPYLIVWLGWIELLLEGVYAGGLIFWWMSTICKLQIYTLVISSYWYIIHIVLYLLLGVKPSIYWRDWHWGLEKFHSLSSSEPPTVLTTSGVWSRLFKAFTSEYCSSYPSKRCFVPAHFCLQIGFDETNSFPDRHAFSPAREARPSPSSRSYQGWLWGR